MVLNVLKKLKNEQKLKMSNGDQHSKKVQNNNNIISFKLKAEYKSSSEVIRKQKRSLRKMLFN